MRISDWSSDVCSSDLANAALREVGAAYPRQAEAVRGISRLWTNLANRLARRGGKRPKQCDMRSEEHTSELQSLMRNSYAVFCLKKKNKNITQTIQKTK